MAAPIRMPDVGTVETEVSIVRWMKAVGEHVDAGDPLLEVETDKGVNPVESVAGGVVLVRLFADGDRVQAGEVIAWVGEAGEQVPAAAAQPKQPAAAARGTAPPASPPTAASAASAAGVAPARIPPVVRALAERHGIDPATLRATGPGGTLTREDVLRARGSGKTAAPEAPVAAKPAAVKPAAAPALRLSPHQAAVARKVSQSHREKPTFTLTVAVDMSKSIALRNLLAGAGQGPAWDAFFIAAAGRAIAALPVFRRWMAGEEVREHAAVDVAFAVGIEEELFAPVVRQADRRDLREIAAEVEALAAKARAHDLTAADTADSCLLVSNLGMLPVERFEAIVYPEHAAALTVGTIAPTPVAGHDGTLKAAPIVRLTLTVDHRLANGLTAARFAARVKDILETAAF